MIAIVNYITRYEALHNYVYSSAIYFTFYSNINKSNDYFLLYCEIQKAAIAGWKPLLKLCL